LAFALGLLHDAGKAECSWQERLLKAEVSGGRVGGPHWKLGAKLLLPAADVGALAVFGHHGGLSKPGDLKELVAEETADEARTIERLFEALPEARFAIDGPLLPEAWLGDQLVLEMGVRLAFSALVDADHLDTAAHFRGLDEPALARPVDMVDLVQRFEARRAALLADRPGSPIDEDRAALYREVVGGAHCGTGIYRLPAPTGSGKTITAAGFALHHAARLGKSRVIVAVPFLTITEQNARVYRDLVGQDMVVEHHSQVEFDDGDHRTRLAAENWDAPFVVTTTVQLFDSLFGRKPARSRKLHRLANAVVVLDEVQALPVSLLSPILDGLRVLSECFGTTVVLTSATQPAFHSLGAWSSVKVNELVAEPKRLFTRLRRVNYEWRLDPKPALAAVADEVVSTWERQALVVMNTVAQARQMYELLVERGDAPVWHLSTRMCPAHRRDVLAAVRESLAAGEPVLLVSTQLIEAGVDVDFPVVFRALAPAESLQQAAGRANREGKRAGLGRVVVFDAADAPVPRFYESGVASTLLYFGPGRADPDDIDALDAYYRDLYGVLNVDRDRRGQEIQARRRALDFQAVAEGRLDVGSGKRLSEFSFRMIDEDTMSVVISGYDQQERVEALLKELADPDRRSRQTFRQLRPFLVNLPTRLVTDAAVAPMCPPVVGDLRRWSGPYHPRLGVREDARGMETVL
jgi:CRISPR-associated endonuclease/helicase Cas3